jgi:hypothetical protein
MTPASPLELSTVTLCCVDTRNHALALRALAKSREGVRFARTVLLTDALPAGVAAPVGVDIVLIRHPLARRLLEFVLKLASAHRDRTRPARPMGRRRRPRL